MIPRRPADDGARLGAWMARRGIACVHVVSPHLDDAVFSLAGFLVRPGLPERTVFTVITHAGPRTDPGHALAMGFDGPGTEFEQRRREDAAALTRLGVPFVHCGVESGDLDEAAADAAARRILPGTEPERCLVLLPLGAGRLLSPIRRMVRRLLRVPPGCGVHGDHVWVRDAIRARIGPAGPVVGYYAEVPYQWANGIADLSALAAGLPGGPFDRFALVPDAGAKLAAAWDYASQLESEFGTRRSWQLRTAGIPEQLFLPAGPP